jgi:cation diffusion facilitator family transporter
MAEESRTVVYAALAANVAIAVSKFAAALFTGSGAMLSEAIHSTVDTGNELLLLLGMRRAARPADRTHPFGHGLQLYFWSFVVAVLVFGIGAGASILDGIQRMRAPAPVEHALVNYIVLGASFAFEGASWVISLRALLRGASGRGLWHALRASKDPATFSPLLEDTAALLGLLVAAVGLALDEMLGLPILDGVASLVIGLILAAVAGFLANECQSLLTGEAVRPVVRDDLARIATDEPGVRHLAELLTMHFGPDDVLVALSLDFDDALGSADVEAAVTRIERRMKQAHPEVKRVFVEAQALQPARRGERAA